MVGEWPECSLGELTDNFDAMRVPVRGRDRHAGPFPYYGASGVVEYVDSYIFDGDYLLIAEDGENLRTRNTPIAFLARGKFWVNNHAHVVRGNEKADTRFLLYTLLATDISRYLSGSTMPKLTQSSLNRITLRTPPLAEQRAIAHILGTLDEKIELNRRMSETLDTMARALFKSWFVDFDPVRAKAERRDPSLPRGVADLFPDSVIDSELGEIPDRWSVRAIGEFANVLGGSTPRTSEARFWDDGQHAWATPKDLAHLTVPVLLSTQRRITGRGLAQIASGLLPAGTVLILPYSPRRQHCSGAASRRA